MITLPSPSVLNEACQEVLHPWPKIPCVLRVSMADMKVRSMASDMLPGVGSAASIEEASAAAGSAASAWHKKGQEIVHVARFAGVSPRPLR